MHVNSLTPMRISGTPRSFLNFGQKLPDIASGRWAGTEKRDAQQMNPKNAVAPWLLLRRLTKAPLGQPHHVGDEGGVDRGQVVLEDVFHPHHARAEGLFDDLPGQ